ncbi:MAG: VOC family protein [Bacteroidia bacterium]|nr:VOC family protein [Bacteroidia bacterium]
MLIFTTIFKAFPAMKPFTTCLWFDGNAEEAAGFYVSVFKNSKMGEVQRNSTDNPGGKKNSVLLVNFTLNGQQFMALNGGPNFKFNKAVSFVVHCETQDEIDYYWEKLIANGGQPVQCGWLKDRFGLSWQIVPANLGKLIAGANSAKVMTALMQMIKFNIAELEAASQ